MLISKFETQNMDQRIKEFEEKYQIILPEQYSNFLRKYNGGYTPDTDLYDNGENVNTIPEFYGIGDVPSPLQDYFVDRFIEKDMLPIARDVFGNQIAIGIGKENQGIIFFCDHERGDFPECEWEDLKTFLDCCHSEVVDKSNIRSVEEREAEMIAQGRGDCVTEAMREVWQHAIDWYNQLNQEEVILDD